MSAANEKGTKDDGGSAFPEICTDQKYNDDREYVGPDTYSYGGMTLRDYFAAKALPAISGLSRELRLQHSADGIAAAAYEVADAMIKARKA